MAEATTLPEFNPSGDPRVSEIKAAVETAMKAVRDANGDPRCKAIALTKLEEASMWGVKSVFVK